MPHFRVEWVGASGDRYVSHDMLEADAQAMADLLRRNGASSVVVLTR